MNDGAWSIPSSVIHHLENIPKDRAVVVLLRHSVREDLPAEDTGYSMPITATGRRLALELGKCLRGRLRTLHSSPLPRCQQTAEALKEGAHADIEITTNRLLGDPGAYVLDGDLAWTNWERLSHEGVMQHLVSETTALPGMARPNEAARFLVRTMFSSAADETGVHVFVSHDSLVTPTAAQMIGVEFTCSDWPLYLEGAFFWTSGDEVHSRYRDHSGVGTKALCGFTHWDVLEFARREVAMTLGLNCRARFFLAGGAFKSLLTGRQARDLDFWAASKHDRVVLIDGLMASGARTAGSSAFADVFELSGRVIEVPHETTPATLADRLKKSDIGLSAVGVEHQSNDEWSAIIHPMALESIKQQEVRLLRPLVNWKYALATLERMRRYAAELSYSVPPEEENYIWHVFESQTPELQAGLIERYQRTGLGGFHVMEEIECRYP